MDQKFSVRDWKNKTLYKESYKEGEKLAENMYIDNDEFEMEMVLDRVKEIKHLFDGYDDDVIVDFVKTHRQDIRPFNVATPQGAESIKDEFNEFVSLNYESGVDYMEENDEKEPSKSDIATAEKDLEFEIPKSTGASNNMRSIIVKKVAKIEKKRDDNDDYTMDLLALKQYIKKDDVRKEVGAKEIRNLVSPLIK